MRGADPDELSAAFSTTASTTKVEPIAAGGISFDSVLFSAGAFTFGRGSYSGAFSCSRQGLCERLLVMMPYSGDALVDFRREKIHSAAGKGLLVDGMQSRSVQFSGNREHLTLWIDQNKLSDHLSHLLEQTVTGSLNFHRDMDLSVGTGRTIKDLVETAYVGLSGSAPLAQSPLALSSFCDSLVSLLLDTHPHRFTEALLRNAPLPTPRHVKRAIDYMHAHLSEPITIEDIAAAANVSIRTLQQGFRRFRLTAPMAYLQELRLQAVHQELLSTEQRRSVGEIALKWGFLHLGRFAAEYRKRFGELPSHTGR